MVGQSKFFSPELNIFKIGCNAMTFYTNFMQNKMRRDFSKTTNSLIFLVLSKIPTC